MTEHVMIFKMRYLLHVAPVKIFPKPTLEALPMGSISGNRSKTWSPFHHPRLGVGFPSIELRFRRCRDLRLEECPS